MRKAGCWKKLSGSVTSPVMLFKMEAAIVELPLAYSTIAYVVCAEGGCAGSKGWRRCMMALASTGISDVRHTGTELRPLRSYEHDEGKGSTGRAGWTGYLVNRRHERRQAKAGNPCAYNIAQYKFSHLESAGYGVEPLDA